MQALHRPHRVRLAIGDRSVGAGCPIFVIAEIGNNHNGSFERAIALVDAALAAGADCAKFQMRELDVLYRETSLAGGNEDLAVEYTIELLRRFALSSDQHRRLAEYCRARGIGYLCTPWDIASVRTLEALGVEAYKIASADLTNLPLLACAVETGKPLLVSTGMSTTAEIARVAAFLSERDASFALLHCQSTYPAALHNIHLNFMATLRAIHPLVGYSGHERGTAVSIGAAALGAAIIERHITLDRTMEGPDHAASLEPGEFKALVEGIRQVEAATARAFAPGSERPFSQGEMINRENLAKSLVAARPLASGQVIAAGDVAVRSPGQGLSPLMLEALIGRTLSRPMRRHDYFFPSDLTDARPTAGSFRFRRPWGIPVRYHDADRFLGLCRPDLIEFHLSYQDMDRNPADYLKGRYDLAYLVHAPELFADSRLMDLATPDAAYRRHSLRQTQRVIDITRSLKRFFSNPGRPAIIANIGGITMDAPLDAVAKAERYRIFADSLAELDCQGVELIPQTMAPFPWHFGGQRHQNIFILPEEVAGFCAAHGLRICLDVSHTKLAANHFGFDFLAGIEALGPHIAHVHFGDAKGLDGEGLQIGEGEIDFAAVGEVLDRCAPSASFIPEIWQGHKNAGEGFFTALQRLEGKL
jgi:sialic acid synthase SpsE/sugar phosphate isomerase/epimerase